MAEQTESKVPQVRFKGFEEEWVGQKLGDISDSYSGGTPSVGNRAYYDGDIPFIRSGEINSTATELFITELGLQNSAAKMVNKGDILYALYGATSGEVGIAQLNGAINQAVLDIQARSGFNYLFLAIWLRKEKAKILGTYLQGGQGNLSGNIVKSLKVDLPSLIEQTQIGQFFKELDGMIGLHQRKHDKLVTLKQAMLQKMFPQNGATIPEIRFKGFSGDWVEKRLAQICEIVGGGTPSTSISEYWGGDIDWYSPTEIGTKVYANGSVKKITTQGFEKCSARILPANRTVLFTSRAGIGDMAILSKDGCTNQGFQSLVLHGEIDCYFVYSMGNLIKRFALTHASGSTFLEISSKQLKKMPILLPTQSEQQKIGAYFRNLDTLITQHATQLEKLKNLKSACLEKMFV